MASGLTCLLAFGAAWRGEEALLVITGAEPRRAIHVQLPSNSLEITVQLQWLLTRTNCTTTELPWTLKTNGRCGTWRWVGKIPFTLGREEALPRVGEGLLGGSWALKIGFPIKVSRN